MSQNLSLLFKSPALIRLPPFKYAHLYFFSLLKKSTLSVGRTVTAPRLQKSVGPAWTGTTMSGDNGGRREVQDRRGDRHWGMSSASGSLEKSRRSLPGGRWAQPPPLKGPRRAGGPLPPGPARRPGRERRTPGRGSGARGWTLPTSAAARLSPNLGLAGPQSPGA